MREVWSPRARGRTVFAILLLVASATIMGIATRIQRAMLFHPRAPTPAEQLGDRVLGLERWWHQSDEGPVEAWFVPGDGASASHPGPAVIYAHGNAELIDPLPRWLSPYRRLGVSVLLIEYRGYGRSAGSPSERAIREDAIAFYDRLVARPEVDRTRIVFHGVSLGGGVVSQLASERRPAALVLQSTFTSVSDLAWEWYRVPRFLLADRFESMVALRSLDVPALVIHGRHDELVPFAHGERLHRALAGSTLLACDAGHNDLPPPDVDYWGEIERFLRRAEIVTR